MTKTPDFTNETNYYQQPYYLRHCEWGYDTLTFPILACFFINQELMALKLYETIQHCREVETFVLKILGILSAEG